MCVVEVIARSAKLLIKDGLTFLADDEEAGFQSENIKKCVLHYLLEIFNSDDGQNASGAQSIWDFITEHVTKSTFHTKHNIGKKEVPGHNRARCAQQGKHGRVADVPDTEAKDQVEEVAQRDRLLSSECRDWTKELLDD